MGRKVFASYKYWDTSVQALPNITNTHVRDYVDEFERLLDKTDQIYKGEHDGEDLSQFQDETIASRLRDRIYDSSITVVFISPMMKDTAPEKDQWIPWEVSYSLKEVTRNGRTSHSNAVLAVVLPDVSGNYDYFIKEESCPYCHCRTLNTWSLFQILRDNMFNIKEPEFTACDNHSTGAKVYKGYSSYIHSVKWSDFKADVVKYFDIAVSINENIDAYVIVKQVK